MKKLRQLLLVLLAGFYLAYLPTLYAQHNEQLTLEELIPGGKNFYRFYPKIPVEYQWHGDNLIALKNDSAWIIKNPEKPFETQLFFTYKDIQNTLSEKTQPVYDVIFAKNNYPLVRFYTSRGIGIYHPIEKQCKSFFTLLPQSKNHELSPDNAFLAYTKGNNLYLLNNNGEETKITQDENKNIVSGQAVHRNEFGITKGIFWSPDSKKLAFYRMDETAVTDYPLVDISARVAQLKTIKYPMAGMTSHEVTIGIFDTTTQETVYLKTGSPKDKYLTNIAWNPDGKSIYIAELNREQNHMKLIQYDAVTGNQIKILFEETHHKYVEPLAPILFVPNNSDRFVRQSRNDGYNHLYLHDSTGKCLKQLTSGAWEVTEVFGFDKKGRYLFFASTQPSPLERHIYSVDLKNGKISYYTSSPGIHSIALSMSGKYFTDRYSAHDNPGKMDLTNTQTKKTVNLSSATNPFTDYDMPLVEQGLLKAADNKTDLYYRLIKPTDFDPTKKYPAIIYVYGGPHSQLVSNRWRYGSGGWETYMAQKGYVIFVMDNRGTSYRGADFENITHRYLGMEETKDQMKGVEFLCALPYMDKNRLGIYGWSFGGFMTINMLLQYPDTFKAGVAGGPVTDWRYYEIMYGERYMDTPEENPEGYGESSLLNKADKLKSRLLIIHGDQDPVVVWQHSLQFLNCCIKAGTHPDYFVYPGHEHNVIGHDRVHLHEHIARYFDDFLK